MARKISIPVPNLTRSTEKTYLSADYTNTLTYLTVVNNFGYANDDFVILGEPGEETTETKDVTSQTGNTQINISSALKFNHNKDTVVYRFEYDQYEIYRGRAGVWTLISTSSIQWDKRETIYVDKSEATGDVYKYRFKNSVAASNIYSDYSPSLAITGSAYNTAGYVVQEIRKIAGDEERRLVTDAEFFRQFNRLREYIQSMRDDWFFLLVDTYKANNGIVTTANTNVYSLATYTDFNFLSTLRYKYYDGTTTNVYHLKRDSKIGLEYDHRDVDTDNNDDWAEKYTLLPPDSSSDQGYIRIWPTSKTAGYGHFYPDYYKKMTEIDDMTDELEVPLVQLFIDYGLGYAFRIKGDDARAKVYGDEQSGYVRKGLLNLERLNKNQKKAVGQPGALKTFRGRKALKTFFKDHEIDHDYLAEHYF